MKYLFKTSLLLFTFCFKLQGIVFAQSSIQEYDCSQTGRCAFQDQQQNTALYFDNLAPGISQEQTWILRNNSSSECRVYLRLKLLEDEQELSKKINISAVGFSDNGKETIIKITTFEKLLKRQSIYLGNLPSSSSGEIVWKIILEETVDNDFQNSTEKFNTLLYSYCLNDNDGKVKGVSTEDNNNIEVYTITILGVSSLSYLIYSHFKSS